MGSFISFRKAIVSLGALLLAGVTISALGTAASARPAYAAKEGKECVYCHTGRGGPRNFRGKFYAAHEKSFAEFDNIFEAKAAGVAANAVGADAAATVASYPVVKIAPALNFVVKDIDGKIVNLGRYQGKVVMVVNVASFCGNTPQYASLQKIYDKYKSKGLVILGFPANEFGKQEPGDEKTIKEFCTSKYNVTFPMFSKIVVKGDGIVPFYKYLTEKNTDPKFSGDIDWNFAKFILDRKGEIVARYKAGADPLKTADITTEIEKQLDIHPDSPAL